ncbi:MAG TPA: creatininase family protein [Rhizobiaceae bacterium]|nr:creatininase family protein [Rhizobiaceae bacterium]
MTRTAHDYFQPGESIFKDTIAEMTYEEVDAAIKRKAIALWGMGVIEQHGPHLPTGTDVYIPSARLRIVKAKLAEKGIEALIVPPFYWGVNHVSASFPASFRVRPEIMVEVMVDVIESLERDGVRHIFCASGHGDALHNKAIFDGVCKASREGGIQAAFVAAKGMFDRLKISLEHPNALATMADFPSKEEGIIDLHAGDWETSLMLALNPEVVRAEKIDGLVPTKLGPADLTEWRKGHDDARRVTPLGYFGDPASATEARGVSDIVREAGLIADVIELRLAGKI